ncbi:hypothetical protein [Vibrio sp.]|uniref:hypothetical protein n=1 Tax=Vibrio sp. TaxID=678 RepID=UPI00311DF6C8
MKYVIFLFLTFFSSLSLADRCYDKTVRNNVNERYLTEGTRYVDMNICTYLVDGASEEDSPILIFAIKLNEADDVKFRHRVRVTASGAASNPCIIGRRGEYSSAINYNPTKSECDLSNNFVSMRFNFRPDDSDSSGTPMLIIFKMDVSQVTSDKFVDLKIGSETVLDQVLYFEYESDMVENSINSCSIEVSEDTVGGMIFNDTTNVNDKYLHARLLTSQGGSFKFIHESNNEQLRQSFLGYYGFGFNLDDPTYPFEEIKWIMENNNHRIFGSHDITLAPKYNLNRSDLLPCDYKATLEIVCE